MSGCPNRSYLRSFPDVLVFPPKLADAGKCLAFDLDDALERAGIPLSLDAVRTS